MFLTESSFQALSRDWCPGEDSRLLAAKHLICNARAAPRRFLVYPRCASVNPKRNS
jgi:hypothetical protein